MEEREWNAWSVLSGLVIPNNGEIAQAVMYKVSRPNLTLAPGEVKIRPGARVRFTGS